MNERVFCLGVGIGNSKAPFVRVYRYTFENLILTINTIQNAVWPKQQVNLFCKTQNKNSKYEDKIKETANSNIFSFKYSSNTNT